VHCTDSAMILTFPGSISIPDPEVNDVILECDITESRSTIEREDLEAHGTGESRSNAR